MDFAVLVAGVGSTIFVVVLSVVPNTVVTSLVEEIASSPAGASVDALGGGVRAVGSSVDVSKGEEVRPGCFGVGSSSSIVSSSAATANPLRAAAPPTEGGK